MKKGKLDSKNKSLYITIIASLILIVLIIAALSFFGNKAEPQTPIKEIDENTNERQIYEMPVGSNVILDLDYEIEFLTKCLNVSGQILSERPSELKNCPTISKEELKRIEYMEGLSGEIMCNSFGLEDDLVTYKRCGKISTGCKDLLEFDWIVPGVEERKFYGLYNCDEVYYYAYSHTVPSENIFIRVNFNWKDYNKAVYGF